MIKDLTEDFVNQMLGLIDVPKITWTTDSVVGSKYLEVWFTPECNVRFHSQKQFITYIGGMVMMKKLEGK